MAKRDDIPKTDPSKIEALIQRLKQSNLEPRDAQLVERLLRLVLSMASLLQHQNASIKRLERLIFGPSSDKRAVTGSSTEEEAAPGNDSEQQPGSGSSPGTVSSSSADQKPKRPGHGRRETFQAEPVSLAVVNKQLERRAGAILEDEEISGERVLIESGFAEGDERINPLAKVDELVSEQDVELRDELNHRRQERWESAQSQLRETRSRDGRVRVRRMPSGRSI